MHIKEQIEDSLRELIRGNGIEPVLSAFSFIAEATHIRIKKRPGQNYQTMKADHISTHLRKAWVESIGVDDELNEMYEQGAPSSGIIPPPLPVVG